MAKARIMGIPHHAWVMIADGHKAIIAQNVGHMHRPDLQVCETLVAEDNPASHLQGTDRPGRVAPAGVGHRSAVETTDFHAQRERAFLVRSARRLEAIMQEQNGGRLVVVAPPHALAVLRETLSEVTRALIVAEIDRDLTKHPLPEIEHLLAGT